MPAELVRNKIMPIIYSMAQDDDRDRMVRVCALAHLWDLWVLRPDVVEREKMNLLARQHIDGWCKAPRLHASSVDLRSPGVPLIFCRRG